VSDREAILQHLLEGAPHRVAIGTTSHKDVRRQERMSRRKFPHVQVVHLLDMRAVRHRHADLSRAQSFRRPLQEDADGFSLKLEPRLEHQRCHHQRSNRVGAIEAGKYDDKARDQRADKRI
jgi:hypothetical protein